MRYTDVLLINTGNDLNVYMSTNSDGTTKSEQNGSQCCGTGDTLSKIKGSIDVQKLDLNEWAGRLLI
jgi:hypothetical protein